MSTSSSTSLISSDRVPNQIQFLPPGEFFVESMNGPASGFVDEDLALRLQGQLELLLRKARRDEGDWPFVDFNHSGSASAAEALQFYWAGEDPKKGGIRLYLRWSTLGRWAVENRVYRRFSPNLIMNDAAEVVIGINSIVGGLANRCAWKSINRIAPDEGPAGHAEAAKFKALVRDAHAAGDPEPLATCSERYPELAEAWFLLQPDFRVTESNTPTF